MVSHQQNSDLSDAYYMMSIHFYEFCNSQQARKGLAVDNITHLTFLTTSHELAALKPSSTIR